MAKNLVIVEMVYNGFFGKGNNITFKELKETGLFNDYPYNVKLTKEQFELILRMGGKMCSILLPINPIHVESILNGSKKYEYRKIRCKRDNVQKIIIYSTAPVMKVVGEVYIDEIIEDDPLTVWNITKGFAGINKDFFDGYYRGKRKAIAYKLGKIKKYAQPLTLEKMGIHFTPQSLVYID